MKQNLLNPTSHTTPITATPLVPAQAEPEKQNSACNQVINTVGCWALVAGILFWAHGESSHDAWFNGEQLTGEIITGFCVGSIGLSCLFVCCVAACAVAVSEDSEMNIINSANEENKAKK